MTFMAKHIPSDSELQSVNGGRLPRLPKQPRRPGSNSKGHGQGGNNYEISPGLTIDKSDSHDTHTHNDNYHYYGDSGSD